MNSTETALQTACRVCGNTVGNAQHLAREMMYGLRDEFAYLECARCGCLQLAQSVDDSSQYYPGNYYSFRNPAASVGARTLREKVLDHIRKALTDYYLTGRPSWAALLDRRYGPAYGPMRILRALPGISRTSAILDVGCGAGQLLDAMAGDGFTRLAGIDPHIDPAAARDGNPRVIRGTLDEVDGRFDLVMFHHSLEHMPDQLGSLLRARQLLTNGGRVLVRIPLTGSFAWRRYRTDWFQLDAPRHLFLHSPRSFELIARAAGLRIIRVIYDSTGAQFWGSEQYVHGIPLNSPRSYPVDPAHSIFTKEQIERFEREATRLNDQQDGDQAGFILEAIGTDTTGPDHRTS